MGANNDHENVRFLRGYGRVSSPFQSILKWYRPLRSSKAHCKIAVLNWGTSGNI